ncbi:SDR family oxidoreductase [Pseudorhodoferax sp.]|uniref:SDR family oxidoreductase n=1 Tax=Pseudorhodoferax sp. TaxID=1993553 RepID=UPI002DD6195A|nr:SDR family oxidoreductase [Pseudorhodoferax sp.]
MQIADAVVLVTGANRGLGLQFARQALALGARKVYAAARRPETIDLPGAVPLALDVTDAAQLARAAAACGDVTLLINNAGISRSGTALDPASEAGMREQFETNVFGPLAASRAFAPVLARNGGGAIVNMLSVLSWLTLPGTAGYCASKSAIWSLTNSLRQELRPQGTLVVGVHVGLMDTDMTRGVPAAKTDPAEVARQVFAAVQAGASEVLADALSHEVRASFAGARPAYLQPA